MQKYGKEFAGRIVRFEAGGGTKELAMEFAGAYGLARLKKLERTFSLETRGSDAVCIRLRDEFTLTGKPVEVEEAFVTWRPVSVRGGVARVRGEKAELVLKVVEPRGARWRVEEVSVRTAHSTEPSTLRRIAFVLPPGSAGCVVEMRLISDF
jgi:hypothetical protein